MSSQTSPSTAPAEAPAPSPAPSQELVFENVAAETNQEWAKLKTELEIDETKIGTEQKEYEAVEAFFLEKKNTIKKITREEIKNIKDTIHDANQEIGGTLDVTAAGNIEFNETTNTAPEATTETPPTGTPEAPEAPAEVVKVDAQTKDFLEQVSQKPVEISTRDGIKNFLINFLRGLATSIPIFGPIINTYLMRLEGYASAEEKQNVINTITAIQEAMKAVGANKTAQRLVELPAQELKEITNVILQRKEFFDNDAQMINTTKITQYFKKIIEKGEIEKYKQPSLSQTIIKMVQGNEPGQLLVDPVAPVPAQTETPQAETPAPTEEEALEASQDMDQQKTEAAEALAREEAIPDNPDAINVAREKLAAMETAVKESIDGQKLRIEEQLADEDTALKNVTEIEIPMARRALTAAESNLSRDPENTELQTKKSEAEKHLSMLEKRVENMKNALTDIRENLMKKFETPGVTTALEATQIGAEIVNKLEIAQGATETEVVKTEREKTEAEKEAEKEKEKIQKEKEKLFEIYKKIKDPENKDGYYHDVEEKLVYIIDEKGNLFKYEYGGGWYDNLWNWTRSWSDNNLPYDTRFYGNKIEQYGPDGTWITTEQEAKNILPGDESKWRSQTARVRMKNDAPDTPDWYNA